MSIPWITTPLHTGAIPADNYTCTIASLLPSTLYEYRAYMIVDGVSYCGETCQITTLPVPTHVPTVTTGVAYDITENSIGVCNSCVTDKGNLNANEYGVLYTQSVAYATDLQMVYGNPNVSKQSISADIAINTGYFTGSGNLLTGLLPNVETFYRAFVKNTVGSGYGEIKSQLTNPNIFVFDADYMVLTYQFTDGRDLDTRTRIVTPDVGQNTQSTYLGWGVLQGWPLVGTQYLKWAGDNTGTGFESVLVDLVQFRLQYPFATEILVDMRGFWYNTVGYQPVNVAGKLYKGGVMTLNPSTYTFSNAGYTSTADVSSVGKQVTFAITGDAARASSGERIATLTYNLITNQGLFNEGDIITPSV